MQGRRRSWAGKLGWWVGVDESSRHKLTRVGGWRRQGRSLFRNAIAVSVSVLNSSVEGQHSGSFELWILRSWPTCLRDRLRLRHRCRLAGRSTKHHQVAAAPTASWVNANRPRAHILLQQGDEKVNIYPSCRRSPIISACSNTAFVFQSSTAN